MVGIYAVKQWPSTAEFLRAVRLSDPMTVELEEHGVVTLWRSSISEGEEKKLLRGYVQFPGMTQLFEYIGVLDSAEDCSVLCITPCDDGSYL